MEIKQALLKPESILKKQPITTTVIIIFHKVEKQIVELNR